jgi:hypothetical protein
MKLYKVKSDSCTGTKTVAILEVGNRALLGSYFGYVSICYINMATDFQFTSTDVIPVCDLNKLTLDKIDNFLNDELSFLEKVKLYSNFKAFNKFYKRQSHLIKTNATT